MTVSGLGSNRFGRAVVWLWSAFAVLATLGLLAVGAYAGSASHADGPGAMPFLMTGLFALCTMAMTVLSGVSTAVLTGRANARWWIRVPLVAASLVCPWLLFPFLADAGDPGEPSGTRWFALSLYTTGVLLLFALNLVAIRRHRRGH